MATCQKATVPGETFKIKRFSIGWMDAPTCKMISNRQGQTGNTYAKIRSPMQGRLDIKFLCPALPAMPWPDVPTPPMFLNDMEKKMV
jgi:hypothetical protein